MNIVGPPLGKVAVVSDHFYEWTFNQALTLFRPSERVTTEWLYVVLCSGIPYEEILMQTRGSAGQSNISLTQCREMLLPVPPVGEQAEIVRRVESVLEKHGVSLLPEQELDADNAVDQTAPPPMFCVCSIATTRDRGA